MSQKELRITMLGGFELAWGDGRSQVFFTAEIPEKPRALLGYLAMNPRLHKREKLAALFWPDSQLALANLRVALNKLRGAGLEDYLDASRTHIGFSPQAGYWFDVQAFDALLSKSSREETPDIPALKKAVAIYQGEFLQGFSIPDLNTFDEEIVTIRQRLDDLVWDALEVIIESTMGEAADFDTGIQYAKRALALAPWREAAHRYLMWFFAHKGQKAAAIMQYERCREALKLYFDADPAPETTELLLEIKNHDSFKAETRPLPPLQRTVAKDAPPFLVPGQRPYFVGRTEPLERLEQALLDKTSSPRLGIVGMGGIGKTTLALHVAHRLRSHFPDGVLWANVADAQPEEIATQWAAAYGFDLSQQRSGEERLAVVRDLIAEKCALLILDDVWTGAKIRRLLPDEGACAILITSRAERVVRSVGAQPVELAQFALENGRRLLLHHLQDDRAIVEPEAVDEICQLVGNLPLAINIAGSYLAYRPYRSLTDFVTLLKQRIEPLNLAEDAQRIRETFELSWNHLEEAQTNLFSLLGLFDGRSFSLEAIAAIAEVDFASPEKLFRFEDKLQSLVQLSLLHDEGNQRYRQHSLLATFAQDKLEDATAAQGHYVRYFAHFAEREAANYQRLHLEWGNLDTAVKFAEHTQQWPELLRFTAVLKDAWFARGRFDEARQAFELAFHAAVRLEDEPKLARNWLWWGQACLEQGDPDEARNWLQQALSLYDELADGVGIADAEYELARLDIEQSQLEDAERRLNRITVLRQTQNDEKGIALALYRFARLRHRQKDNETARSLALEAAEMQRRLGDYLGECRSLRLLVSVLIELKQNKEAFRYANQVMALAKELDDLGEIAMAKRSLASVYLQMGYFEEANQFADESYALLEKMGDRQAMTAVRFVQLLIKRSEKNYEEALSLAEACLVEYKRLKDDFHVAYCLGHQGDIYNFWDDKDTAVQKWRDSLEFATKVGNHDLVGKLNERLRGANGLA
ncbi:MAG: tetratricopeptide repeat protein [Ardenticatenaceae bacterium]|nr:tetratricopeptide repeat protein [Ardenticatenaceae bacterium]